MTYLRGLMELSDAAVRSRLSEYERVLATGRCADISTTGDLDSGGAGWTYAMVTNRRVHWVPDIERQGDVCSLELQAVQSCTERLSRHRSALTMRHDPLVRQHMVPNGRPRNSHYLVTDL